MVAVVVSMLVSSHALNLRFPRRDKAEQGAQLKGVKRIAAGGDTRWVFNWRAEGWAPDSLFKSTIHDFGGGFGEACGFIRKRSCPLFTLLNPEPWTLNPEQP